MVPRQGGMLPGDANEKYLKVPVVALLVIAPLMGAVYAMFLPFIGFALLFTFLGKKAVAATRSGAVHVAATMSPSWRPGEAYLAGKTGRTRGNGDEPSEGETPDGPRDQQGGVAPPPAPESVGAGCREVWRPTFRWPTGWPASRLEVGPQADDPLLQREPDQVGPAVQAELLHHVLAVRHRGLHADAQQFGDLLVAAPLRDELQHLLLAVGQRARRGPSARAPPTGSARASPRAPRPGRGRGRRAGRRGSPRSARSRPPSSARSRAARPEEPASMYSGPRPAS